MVIHAEHLQGVSDSVEHDGLAYLDRLGNSLELIARMKSMACWIFSFHPFFCDWCRNEGRVACSSFPDCMYGSERRETNEHLSTNDVTRTTDLERSP